MLLLVRACANHQYDGDGSKCGFQKRFKTEQAAKWAAKATLEEAAKSEAKGQGKSKNKGKGKEAESVQKPQRKRKIAEGTEHDDQQQGQSSKSNTKQAQRVGLNVKPAAKKQKLGTGGAADDSEAEDGQPTDSEWEIESASEAGDSA